MNLKDLNLEDLSESKQIKIKRIVEAAKIEFDINGITNSKISDIAKRASVGEASIYRYFTEKLYLVRFVAFDYWKEQREVFDEYKDDNIDNRLSGLEKVKSYLEMFIEMYFNHRRFLKFMEDLDSYLVPSNTTDEENEFFEHVYYIKQTFIDLFEEGIHDGSIKPSLIANDSYSFVSQVMVSTTQKMALRLGYNHISDDIYAVNCLNTTIDMFINYIGSKKAN